MSAVTVNGDRLQSSKLFLGAVVVLALAVGLWTWRSAPAQAAAGDSPSLEAGFAEEIQPFLEQHCLACHNADTSMSGIRVDVLDGKMEDRRLRLWSAVKRRIDNDTMPPEGLPRPDAEDRKRVGEWIGGALEVARLRPTPKNGLVRRLTVAQYQNSLKELLGIEDDITDVLPPDAISEDGFVNNTATLELSPLLMESYFDIAEEGLSRAIVNPDEKPQIQNFKVTLGDSINPSPLEEKLILGANSMLLDDADYVIDQLKADKTFAFEPFWMKTKYRFIEGYQGNGTVRGWRDFDSIYHAVFAGMRGSRGYPKGEPYEMVPDGILLRPAIPHDEIFGVNGTFGHSANFKISLRELPHHGRFQVRVKAAKYNDGLLLDEGEAPRDAGDSISHKNPTEERSLEVKQAGVYQMDVYETPRGEAPAPDASRLSEALVGAWDLNEQTEGLEGDAKLVASPFGQAVELDGDGDSVVLPGKDEWNVGSGDFTVAAWVKPSKLRGSVVAALGGYSQKPGWRFELSGNKGAFRIGAMTPEKSESGESVVSPARVLVADEWQHIAAVVRRGESGTYLYVNGVPVARGTISADDLGNAEADLHLGRLQYSMHYAGALDEVRLYKRALGDAELQALIEPGREFAKPPAETPQNVTVTLGGRPFSRELKQPAFAVMRLDAGRLNVEATHKGVRDLDRIVLTRLDEAEAAAERFLAFEKRKPRVGVHMGFRRDCGSTFAPVGEPQTVTGEGLQEYVFEGAIANFPEPSVEKNNVNYLAGVREIAVRSEYTDGRDMPRLKIHSVEFEGPYYETWPPKPHQAIFIDSKQKSNTSAYAREIIGSFAERAYRRPVKQVEEDALVDVFEKSLASGETFQRSIKDALLVAMTSPQFLFLVETSETPEPETLDDYELASKLSYFLWNGPPDETTLGLAARGELHERLDEEVARLISDPRFERFTEQFSSQWLNLEKFDVLEPDRKQFEKLTRDTRSHLRQEPVELVKHVIRKNRPVSELIDSKYVMANEAVATYYDLGEKTESGFDFVPIVHGRPELGGLLTQAALMAGLSDGRESNPVKRGAWVARKIVAEPPDPPPPNVPDLEASTEGLSLRRRLEQHRSLPGCMQCHMKIDPWGVALEQFDAGGRLKEEPADAVSTLPGGAEVDGANDLKQHLTTERLDQVAFSVLKHMQVYANGRSLAYNEEHFLKQDAKKLRESGYRMQDLIRYVVNSPVFLEK